MLIDRTHKPWIFGSALTLAVSASAYWATSRHLHHGASGGSVSGLVFGILGSLLMVFAALLAVRKRLPTWRVGSAQLWLRGHLWLGSLGFVLILFHAGFGWGGLLENLLWISFGLVVATGIAGVILQQVIPRLLTSNVPLETMVAQIPFLSRTMQFRADQLVAKQAGVLEIEFESLKPFAEEVLKQQRVLKRESDFPKELAKVYANVPLPEGDAKKPHASAPAPIVATKPAAAAAGRAEGVSPPVQETAPVAGTTGGLTSSARLEEPVAVKPKSPLELMREKAAAKAAGSEPAAAPTEPAKKLSPIEQMRAKKAAAEASAAQVVEAPVAEAASVPPVEPATPAAEPAKKLSPIEQMRAKKAAAEAAAAPVVEALVVDAASVPPVEPATPAAEPAKKLSPIEQMRAKKAAAEAAAAQVVEAPVAEAASVPPVEPATPAAEPAKKLSPIEQMRAKKAAAEALSQTAAAPAAETTPVVATENEKKLSPMEQMKAKLAAAKTATEPSEHKPLTIDKSADASADKPASPVKKPTPIAKPSAEKPASVTPIKPAAPVPPALLAELRDFHVRVVRSFLVNGRSPQYRLDDDIASRRVFAQLRSDLPAELHDVLQQLEDLCEERRQFNTQLRLHRWLHWWLILHIPPSIALMVLFVAHVIVSLRVVPFGK